MFRNEGDVQRLFDKVAVEGKPDPTHRGRLREQMFREFAKSRQAQSVTTGPGILNRAWRKMMSHRKASLAASVALVSLLVLGCIFVSHGFSSSIAFADVQARIQNAQTLVFDVFSRQSEDVDLELTGRAFFKEPGFLRYEQYGQSNTIVIADTVRDEFLHLNTEAKTAVSVGKLIGPAAAVAAKGHGIGGQVVRNLKELVAGSEESLGNKTIDGRKAVGFRAEKDGTDVAVWVDASTGDPLLVEFLSGSHKPMLVLRNIELDTELDDSLFSLEPPEGYEMIRADAASVFRPLDQPAVTDCDVEADLVAVLRLYAESYNGIFSADPKGRDFTVTARPNNKGKIVLGINNNAGYFVGTLPEVIEKGEELRSILSRGRAVLKALKDNETWEYVGEGVELDDGNAPVCWYRPEDSETYRVIYGDLSIKNVPPEDLPKKAAAPGLE